MYPSNGSITEKKDLCKREEIDGMDFMIDYERIVIPFQEINIFSKVKYVIDNSCRERYILSHSSVTVNSFVLSLK